MLDNNVRKCEISGQRTPENVLAQNLQQIRNQYSEEMINQVYQYEAATKMVPQGFPNADSIMQTPETGSGYHVMYIPQENVTHIPQQNIQGYGQKLPEIILVNNAQPFYNQYSPEFLGQANQYAKAMMPQGIPAANGDVAQQPATPESHVQSVAQPTDQAKNKDDSLADNFMKVINGIGHVIQDIGEGNINGIAHDAASTINGIKGTFSDLTSSSNNHAGEVRHTQSLAASTDTSSKKSAADNDNGFSAESIKETLQDVGEVVKTVVEVGKTVAEVAAAIGTVTTVAEVVAGGVTVAGGVGAIALA